MRALLMRVLRRLKCLVVGHHKDNSSAMAYARPGYWRCARCARYLRVDERLGLEHAAVLRKAGWTDDEINRMGFRAVTNSEVLTFLRAVRRASDAAGADTIDHYEQGYIMGYYAAMRDAAR